MVLLAINTTIVTTGIVVFLIVILILVGILLFAKAKLTAKGDVKISINNGDRIITTEQLTVVHPGRPENIPAFGLWW